MPPASFSFDAKIENEEQIVDGALAALARGALPGDAWDRLQAAARRDGRLIEVGFAFESVSRGQRLKTVKPSVAAEFHFQAGRFLAEAVGEESGAAAYLERALALAPAHAGAFARLESIYEKDGQKKARLAELYAATAPHRARGEQALMLRRAAELFAADAAAKDRVLDLWQQVLRLEPGDEEARSRLEALYLEAGRFRDVIRMNEQWLAREPPPDDALKKVLLERIVDLYADKIDEPARAMAHVERLLALDPKHEGARKVAQKLIGVRGLAGRAASALATAMEAYGPPRELAHYLMLELESSHGPRRALLLARLGKLKQDRIGDDAGALEAFDQALALDPDDDDVRLRYVTVATRLGRHTDATKTLGRVISAARDPAVKSRANVELGEALLRAGDPKRAKAALSSVLAAADAPADVALGAARALRELHEAANDSRALCNVLERVAELEEDPERRREANERLAALATKLRDTPRAIAAYERLLSTSARADALEALATLYRGSGKRDDYARVLDEQSKGTDDETRARALMVQAAEVRARQTKDSAGAIAACRKVVERFGPARDVLSLLIPLLEADGLWAEQAEALAQEAELASGPERAAALARLGVTRLQRLGDAGGAIEAFAAALALDRRERSAREGLESLVDAGEHRLAAACVLEPVYRDEGAIRPLLAMLELRSSLAPEVDVRLGALEEAADLAAAAGAAETARAAGFVERGLTEAAENERPVGPWLERLDRLDLLAGGAADPGRRAAILGKALGDREVASPEQSGLAQRAAEAYVTVGDVRAALELYRRALAFEPHSRRLLYRVGALEQHGVGDLSAAIATYRAALAADPGDGQAHATLEELYARAGRWEDLCSLLEDRIARVGPEDARELRAKVATVAASHGDEGRARAQCALLLDDPELAPDHLDLVARVLGAGDAGEMAARALARLCDLQRRSGDVEAALETALRAARAVPGRPEAWDRAEELARSLKRPEGVARAYEEVLSAGQPREQALAVGERAVRYYDEWFEDPAGLCHILERVLELDPGADWAFDRLKLVLDAAARWDDLFSVYDRALASAGKDRRALLLEDAAQTAKDFADRPDLAIHYLEALKQLRPSDAKVASALERLYERQGRHRDLIALLTERLPSLSGDDAQRARTRIGARWLDLEDPTATFEVIEPLLSSGAAPETWGLLERIMECPAPVRLRAAARLRERYLATGDDAGLARALLVELEAAKSPEDRVRRHLELADLYEKLGDLWSALDQTGAAVVLGPGDEATRARLAQLAERGGRFDRLADLLIAAAGSTGSPRLRVTLTMQAAELRSNRLGDAPGAIALFSAVLATQGVPDADARAAARALEPLLEAAGRSEEQLDVAERRATLEEDPAARLEATGRAARLATRLGQDARGVELWQKRLDADKGDSEALDALVELLERVGDARRLAGVLELRSRTGTDPARSRSDRARIAALLAGELDRPEEAIKAWRRVERDFGEADDAALALAALYRRMGRHEDLARVLERVLVVLSASRDWRGILGLSAEAAGAVVELTRKERPVLGPVLEALEQTAGDAGADEAWSAAARALCDAMAAGGLPGTVARDVYARLAEWHRDRRHDLESAEAALELALEQDAASASLLAALAELRRRSPSRPLVDTLVRLSRATGGDLALLREGAEVARDSVGDGDLARAMASEALELARARLMAGDEGEPRIVARWAIECLAGLCEAEGDAKGILDALAAGDALPLDLPVRLAMRRRAAGVALDMLGDPGRASALLEAILADDPRDEDTAERLASVYATSARWRELRDLLAEQARVAQEAGDLPRAAGLWGRAAVVAEDRLADAGGAATMHERVVAIEPAAASLDALARLASARADHDGAVQWLQQLAGVAAPEQKAQIAARLGDAYRALRDWPKLARLVAASAALAPDDAARVASLREAAALYSDRCGTPALAIPLLEQATRLAPGDQAVSLSLADVLGQAGRFDEAQALLQSMLDAFGVRRPRERAPVHYQLARLELARGKRARAVIELEAAARVDPQSADIQRLLAELARDDGQLERAERSYRALLAAVRRREEAGTPFEVSRSEVLLELSAIAERQGHGDRARELLESALEAAAEGGPRSPRLLYRLAEMQLASRHSLDAGSETMRAALDLEPQPERALSAVRRALELEPGHVGLIGLCERIGRQPGHEGALAEALRLRAALPGASFEALREAVEAALRVSEPAAVEGLLGRFVDREQTRGEDPAHLSWALGVLGGLREAAGDARGGVELKRRAASLAEPDVARQLELDAARMAARSTGDLALAAELYEALHSADPADREAWAPLAEVYRELGDARKLAELLGSVVDYVEDASERARLRLDRVRTMVTGMGLEDAEAARLLREIVDEDVNQVDAALMLAEVLERSGTRDELAEHLTRQLDAAKDRGDARSVASLALRLGGLLRDTERLQARNVYYVGIDWEPRNADLLDALLELLDLEEDASERADVLEKRLALEEGGQEGPIALAIALELWEARRALGDAAATERALDLGLRVCPGSTALGERLAETLAARAITRDAAGDHAGARADLAQAFALARSAAAGATDVARARAILTDAAGQDAGDRRALLTLASLEAAVEEWDAAVAALRRLVELEEGPLSVEATLQRPADDESTGLLAEACALAGRDAEGLAILEQAIAAHKGRRSRELASLYWRRARVARHLGDVEGERHALVQALEAGSQSGHVCSDVATRALELGEIDLANRALRAVTLLKTPGPMSKALAYQRMGEIAWHQGDPKRALTLVKRALAEDPALESARALVESLERGA